MGARAAEATAAGDFGRKSGPRAAACAATAGSAPGFQVSLAGGFAHLAGDAETLVRRIGSGERGLVDGASGVAQFSEPNGLCLLPPEVAAWVGYDVVVADTVNHAL